MGRASCAILSREMAVIAALRRALDVAVPMALLVGATGAAAQTAPDGNAADAAPPKRPGLIKLGKFYLTPYLSIGNMGVDTNVFYTATDRQTDFAASGGPGLEIVRPLDAKAKSRIRLDGAADYLYYARTKSLRRWNGQGSALIELHGLKTDVAAEESYVRSYSRANYQVDARVQQETERTRGLLTRRLGDRFELACFGERQKARLDSQDYLGTDLRGTMSEDSFLAGGELRLALSVKTQLVGGGEEDWYRFPFASERNGRSTLAFGGLRTDATALVAGQALAGVRWFELDGGGRRNAVYAAVSATWNLTPMTKLGASYTRDVQYSVFSTSGSTPTNLFQTVQVFLDKMLTRTIYLNLTAGQTILRSDGSLRIVTPGGESSAVRDDTLRTAGAELGYQFRSRVRIGATARYVKRRSSFETFGIQGLLAGLTVTYNPPQPKFR